MLKLAFPALVGICSSLFLFSGHPLSAATLLGDLADRELQEDTSLGIVNNSVLRVGSSSSAGGGRNALFVFQLPNLGAIANPFQSADLGLFLASVAGTPNTNVDLYGLGRQSSATLSPGSGVLGSNRFYELNSVDAGSTLIQQDFVMVGNAVNQWYNTSASGDTNLLNFLNTQYASGAGANQFVVIRANPDLDGGTNVRGHNFSAADSANDPVITYTAIPEPGSCMLVGLGVLMLVRRYRREVAS